MRASLKDGHTGLFELVTVPPVDFPELVQRAISDAEGNVSKAARLLGITRIMMKRRLDRLGL